VERRLLLPKELQYGRTIALGILCLRLLSLNTYPALRLDQLSYEGRKVVILALYQSPDQGALRRPPNVTIEHFYELQTTIQMLPFMPLQLQADRATNLVETLSEKPLKLLAKQSASLKRSHSLNLSTNMGE
jgi:hypothetical protein